MPDVSPNTITTLQLKHEFRSTNHPYMLLPVLVLLVTGVAVVFGTLALQYVQTRLVSTTGESLALAAAGIADKLDLVLYERYRDIQKISKVLQSLNLTAINDYLHWLKQSDPSYRWLGVADASGHIVAATDPQSLGKDVSRQQWFRAIRKRDDVQLQDVHLSDETGGVPAITFAGPIKGPRNEFLGAFMSEVGLTTLEDVFLSTKDAFQIQGGRTAKIEYHFLSRDGELIVDSILRQEGRVNLKQMALPSALFIDTSQSGYVEETHLRRHLSVVTGYAQTKGYGSFVGLQWGILVRMDRDDILTPVRSVLWKLGFIGVGVWLPFFLVMLWTTKRVRNEWRRTEESEKWLSITLMSISDGVIATDNAGHIVSMNVVAESLTGWTQAEAKAKTLQEVFTIIADDIATAAEGRVAKIIQEGVIVGPSNHTILIRKDRSQRFIDYSRAPIRDTRGRVLGIILTFRDITSRKQAEDALRQSQEQLRHAQKMDAIGKLAGGVAHDFNNYLTAIMGYCSLLVEALGPNSPYRSCADSILKATEGAAALTNQLLAFSRKQVLQAKVLDLNVVIMCLESLLRRIIGEDIELVIVPSAERGFIRADPGQLEQIIINLAANARDAMPQGGKLRIETANVDLNVPPNGPPSVIEKGPYLMLTVSDTGCGMDSETQARIFEPFFTSKPKGKGTGLGLSMVYGIVNQSGGSISVQSELGKGSTFQVYLPQVEHGDGLIEPYNSLPQSTYGTETILLVEDEDRVRAITSQTLQANGYTVLEAANGDEALRISARHKGAIHLLLTDVVMPQLSGREVAEHLASSRPEMNVLYISGYTADAIIRHGVFEARIAFLQKPFQPYALLDKVRQVLDNKNLNQPAVAGSFK